jgi:CheY-like chemotaxis protein
LQDGTAGAVQARKRGRHERPFWPFSGQSILEPPLLQPNSGDDPVAARTASPSLGLRRSITMNAQVDSVETAAPVILIVEDDGETLDTYARALRLAGYEVAKAPDAESALRAMDDTAPAAILVDLHLPSADGLDLVRTLRARPRHVSTPIAIVTADYTLSDSVLGELEYLNVGVRYKPLWVDDLLGLAGALVGREA